MNPHQQQAPRSLEGGNYPPRGQPASYNPSQNAAYNNPSSQQQPQQQFASAGGAPVHVFNPGAAAYKGGGPRPPQQGGGGPNGGSYGVGGAGQPHMDFGLDAITAAANSQVKKMLASRTKRSSLSHSHHGQTLSGWRKTWTYFILCLSLVHRLLRWVWGWAKNI